MRAMEGEILKNKFTEDLHQVTKIGDSRVILENENGSVWLSLRIIGTFFFASIFSSLPSE